MAVLTNLNTHGYVSCVVEYTFSTDYVFVSQAVVHVPAVPQERRGCLMIQGVEGRWVVAVKVWLAAPPLVKPS